MDHDTKNSPGLWPLAVVCMVTLLVSVICWPGSVYPGDPLAVRVETTAMLSGRLSVETPPPGLDRPGEYFVQNPTNGWWYSKYGSFGAVTFLLPVGLSRRLNLGPMGYLAALNGWNTLLTVLLAGYLYRLASLYTSSTAMRMGYPLACLFGTFLWSYTRAQSTELPQVLLAVVGFDSLVRVLRGDRSGWRVGIVWACVGALVLTRVYYLTLLPIVMLVMWRSGARGSMLWAVGLIVALLTALNAVKFGAPWRTGYHAFEAGRHVPTLNPVPGLWGFFVSTQKNIWFHFGLVVVACWGARTFWREHRAEAWVILTGVGLYLLPLCTVPSWAGEWGYGPRYLLFGLPLVSVAALKVNRRVVWAGGAVLLVAQGILHWQVNRIDWFAANRLRVPFQLGVIQVDPNGWPDDRAPYPAREYFDSRPWGWICRDLIATDGDATRHPLWEKARQLGPEQRALFSETVKNLTSRDNWFWTHQ